MFKKIVGLIVVIVLFCGSICGIVYGVKYTKYDSSQAKVIEQKDYDISILNKQIRQLKEEQVEIIGNNMIALEEKNQKISELEAEIDRLKTLYGVDDTTDEYTLTIIPYDGDGEGYITFSVDKIVLNNVHRAQTFSYTIEEGQNLWDYSALADGLFGYEICEEGNEGLVCVYLLEELTEIIDDLYYINFCTVL